MTDEELGTFVRDLALIVNEIKRRAALVRTARSDDIRRENLDAIVKIATQLLEITDVSPPRN